MYKIWFGLAFAAIVVNPASAQDYRKNFNECVKELGLYHDNSYTHKLQPEVGGRTLHRWYFHGEAQRMAFDSCLVRRANSQRQSK